MTFCRAKSTECHVFYVGMQVVLYLSESRRQVSEAHEHNENKNN